MTPIQGRILRFFQENPQAVETSRGIASWLGVEPSLVEAAVGELATRRWLSIHQTSMVTGYALTNDAGLLAEIREALEGS